MNLNHLGSLPASVDRTPADSVKKTGETLDVFLSEADWDLANEHTSYIAAVEPSIIEEEVRIEALTGLAFERAADYLYPDTQVEWKGDFRSNPRVRGDEVAEILNTDGAQPLLTLFEIGDNDVMVNTFQDSNGNRCASPHMTLRWGHEAEAPVHVTGCHSTDERSFTFFGARTHRMAECQLNSQSVLPGAPTPEDDISIEARECFNKNTILPNQIPVAEVPELPSVPTLTEVDQFVSQRDDDELKEQFVRKGPKALPSNS